MKLIGLTGGVGMGKSTAAGFFLQAGARVVDTDEIARELVKPGQPALTDISRQFGNSIISSNGFLNRAALAHIVFNDESALRKLEAILHPRIRQAWQSQVSQWSRENCPVAVVVIPLLYETRAEGQFDRITCVACSPASQQSRLRQRGWPEGQVQRRIAAQMPIEQKMTRAHHVIWSEGTPEVHGRQVAEILKRI